MQNFKVRTSPGTIIAWHEDISPRGAASQTEDVNINSPTSPTGVLAQPDRSNLPNTSAPVARHPGTPLAGRVVAVDAIPPGLPHWLTRRGKSQLESEIGLLQSRIDALRETLAAQGESESSRNRCALSYLRVLMTEYRDALSTLRRAGSAMS